MASRILAIGTSVPEHRLETRDAVKALTPTFPQLSRLEGAELRGTRYICEPVEVVMRKRPLTELQAAYREHSQRLALAAAREALEGAGLRGEDIDLVITVSCTGYLVPSLEVLIAPELGLRPDVLRLPITELGCSGGAAALAFAHRHLQGFPEHKVLVIAVEIPSLSCRLDATTDNLTGNLVFADGAGAAVFASSDGSAPGVNILDTAAHLVPDSADVLGFDLRDGGFHVVLARRLARVLERHLRPVVENFIAERDIHGVDFYAVHAAGSRILDTVQDTLRLAKGKLDSSRDVFLEFGNTSSAAIFFTLKRLTEKLPPAPRTGLGIGLGPGVSVELMHLRWVPVEAGLAPRGRVVEPQPVTA